MLRREAQTALHRIPIFGLSKEDKVGKTEPGEEEVEDSLDHGGSFVLSFSLSFLFSSFLSSVEVKEV